jgi:methylated-DNA-[protein]-cysteine S-methyltransferase
MSAMTAQPTTTTVRSPVGPIGITARAGRIVEVSFGGAFEAGPPCEAVTEARRQLGEYFAGTRREFELPLEPPADGLVGMVCRALAEIPYGGTASYKEVTIACGLGADRVRDVGAALGRNPLAIVLPCHRVIGSDGSLVGFGGGLEVKRALLDLEAPQLTLA